MKAYHLGDKEELYPVPPYIREFGYFSKNGGTELISRFAQKMQREKIQISICAFVNNAIL